ncbi:unnamed protein product [Blepharisma stoltei]|uniref:Uncharacterized protein n=1 Tax=Blepharisma stoltei TaxID=1481888 RepID=A0AAU9KAT3_9CILI|nr:unnamed protein product [Blepharisma stoltei]
MNHYLALYATKAASREEITERIIAEMEKIQCRGLRVIRNSLQATANEIHLIDLGMMSARALLDKRALFFWAKVSNAKEGSILKNLVKINYEEKLGWEKWCRELLDKYGLDDCMLPGGENLKRWRRRMHMAIWRADREWCIQPMREENLKNHDIILRYECCYLKNGWIHKT